ncbi:ribonuclease III [Bifidobacterium sp.]|uniref:ribonuclease III n=1 Tax=Bifidobacterium sp. TaxID=41200 RepID=UPI0025BAE088|nr:ribonuclease III [Bifidobacterium sp.]MCH4208905.1 ribonuclease III [Bifidobacterium sp.]MCI1224452.1 ribonuclease III [Bifidobacterium sp.]
MTFTAKNHASAAPAAGPATTEPARLPSSSPEGHPAGPCDAAGHAADHSSSPALSPGTPADELLAALGTTLSPEILVQALTHRSFSHEHPGALNYERLEFLGDAVLELIATETLYRLHPDMNEGQLAKMRAKAVSEEALSQIAREKLHVGPYILLGHGETEGGGSSKSSILCDIVESLIGATFVEHGIEGARPVVHRLIDDTLEEVSHEGPALDWKTSLTVKAHDMGLEDPRYRMAVDGPEYAQTFTARAVLPSSDEVLGTGSGTSKRKAQLAAAQEAWETLDARDSDKHGRHGGHHRDGSAG